MPDESSLPPQEHLYPVDRWIVIPVRRFIKNSTTSGILLLSSAVLAMILSNSPLAHAFHSFWELELGMGFNGNYVIKSLHHWINDGLMGVFFFVVGLELKREIVAGELSTPRKAILPLVGAIGGMIVPALVYLFFNRSGMAVDGWGIPMATDIAFALGILYLLGPKVPLSLKVFLTALAIADDLGAVLVIAFFYTSDINEVNLIVGGGFLLFLMLANRIGVRNTTFYAIMGIGGLWLAFLTSGVHATIAAVLAAFTIPANKKIPGNFFTEKLDALIRKFRDTKESKYNIASSEQLSIVGKIRHFSKNALTPLQRLEHSMHPLVAFVIMPIFALANAGITFTAEMTNDLISNVSLGVFFGLLLGKFIGVTGSVMLMIKLKIASPPKGMNTLHLLGVGLLAGIGFTMSLFISALAFKEPEYAVQAKLGILAASTIAGTLGYFVIRKASDPKYHPTEREPEEIQKQSE